MQKKKKKNKLLLFFLISFSFRFGYSFAQTNVDTIIQNSAYKPGEKLLYSVKYGAVKGGEAALSIDVIPSGDTYYYYVKASAVTTGVATNFAKIYDVYESYIDILTGYPVKAVRNIRENNYTRYNEVFFFRDSNYVWSINSGKHWIPKNAFDILSAFYYARRAIFSNKNLQKGDEIELTTFFDGDLLPVKIKYKDTDYVKTKFGKVKCLRFVQVLEKNSPFKKEDDLQIWFSDDGNYIPVKIRMKSKIGVVKAILIDYEKLKHPLGVK